MTTPLPIGVPWPVDPNPALAAVIAKYKRERDTKQLRRPGAAKHGCWAFTDDFVRFAQHHGLDAKRVVVEWRYLGEQNVATQHFVAKVGSVYLDWTANQFAAPRVDSFPIPYIFREVAEYIRWIDDEVWRGRYKRGKRRVVESIES